MEFMKKKSTIMQNIEKLVEVCRICECQVFLKDIKSHSKFCMEREELKISIASLEKRIRGKLTEIFEFKRNIFIGNTILEF